MRGTLFLVVGPSGAGKDSLIDGAKAVLGGNEQFVFPKRYVTRPPDAGGEDHIPVTEASYEALVQRGDMLLHWDAHNLRYGVPIAMSECLNSGMNVIVNVSRTVVDQARKRLSPVIVLYVTVSDDILAQRLRMRGRETMDDIEKRVARAQEYRITGEDVRMIDNGGALDLSITTFLQAIGASATT